MTLQQAVWDTIKGMKWTAAHRDCLEFNITCPSFKGFSENNEKIYFK